MSGAAVLVDDFHTMITRREDEAQGMVGSGAALELAVDVPVERRIGRGVGRAQGHPCGLGVEVSGHQQGGAGPRVAVRRGEPVTAP